VKKIAKLITISASSQNYEMRVFVISCLLLHALSPWNLWDTNG